MPAKLHYWEVWYPKATATGMLVARCRIEPAERVLLHAAPKFITVEVYDDDRAVVAFGKDLERTEESPMCELTIDGKAVVRRDLWPTEADAGATVLLPGGEAGMLERWWNSEDRKEWRWSVEFYNSVR
jgi:hypothetical protein